MVFLTTSLINAVAPSAFLRSDGWDLKSGLLPKGQVAHSLAVSGTVPRSSRLYRDEWGTDFPIRKAQAGGWIGECATCLERF
jgi:hypothetical protein